MSSYPKNVFPSRSWVQQAWLDSASLNCCKGIPGSNWSHWRLPKDMEADPMVRSRVGGFLVAKCPLPLPHYPLYPARRMRYRASKSPSPRYRARSRATLN